MTSTPTEKSSGTWYPGKHISKAFSSGGKATATRVSDGGGGGPEPEPLRPTDEGVARLLEVLQAADYLELAHLKQLGERLVVEWEVLQVENCLAVYERACATRCDQVRRRHRTIYRGPYPMPHPCS